MTFEDCTSLSMSTRLDKTFQCFYFEKIENMKRTNFHSDYNQETLNLRVFSLPDKYQNIKREKWHFFITPLDVGGQVAG